ncbi:MAG TPA: HAMP domain-containing sensor histidine kinase [Acidimicrobiales bacterium]|nr:HAMP domain-containing sensor histidine kinase [Acidimicrobiales bacterium]
MAGAVTVTVLGTVLLVIGGRRVVARSAEYQRVNQLLAASARTAQLRAFDDALLTAAEEVKAMTHASSALCAALDAHGEWVGMIVDGDGGKPAPTEAVAALRELAEEDHTAREIDLHERLLTTRLALPPARTVVVTAARDGAVPFVAGSFRDGRISRVPSSRVKTLQSFVDQAALSVANARLFEEIEAAYLHQLDLNRQKGEFVATVSHELRTPVAAIIGTIETVSRLGDRLDDERRANLLAGAVGYGERLSRVIEELLLVAAAEQSTSTIRSVEIDLPGFVRQIVKETSVATDGRVVATVRPVSGVIRTDESKLQRVLLNLIENAAKYAPDGPIEIEVMAAGARVVFFVTDHGPGIAAADRERVFERFVQLNQSLTRSQGGLGLGLYLCRQLATVLDGELVLTETPGGGCSFCLAVSRDLSSTVEAADAPPSAAGGVLRRPAKRAVAGAAV